MKDPMNVRDAFDNVSRALDLAGLCDVSSAVTDLRDALVPDEDDGRLLDADAVSDILDDMLAAVDMVEGLDPGIAAAVCRLRATGFDTIDSGDGRSKPPEARTIEGPHIFCVLDPSPLINAHEVSMALRLLGDGWSAQVLPPEGHTDALTILMLTKAPPRASFRVELEVEDDGRWIAQDVDSGALFYGADAQAAIACLVAFRAQSKLRDPYEANPGARPMPHPGAK